MNKSWEWRRNYRVWEANRKVFLYPENWIEPELRPSSRAQTQLHEVVTAARARRTSVLVISTQRAATLLAGGALAADLGRDLYYVDLRRVVSTYLGETEKNLDQAFAAAEEGRVVLLLDEADALFDKQSEIEDSHDRYANVEVSYLLGRIEMFEGLAILATKSSRSTVAALLRRFAFVIDQPIVMG